MISKLNKILTSEEKYKLKIIIILNSLCFFFEFITLASLPAFLGLVTNSETVFSKFQFLISYFGFEKINDQRNFTAMFGIFVIFIFFVKNFFLYLLLIIENKFFKKFKIRLSNKLFNSFIYSPYEFLGEFNSSQISRTIITSVTGVFYYIQNIFLLIRETLAIIAIFFLLIFSNPLAVAVIFSLFLLLAIIYYKLLKPFLKKASENNQILISNIIKTLNETFGSIKDIRVMSKENKIKRVFSDNLRVFENNFYYFNNIQKLPKIFLEIIFLLLIISIALYYFGLDKNFIDFLPVLGLYFVVSLRFLPAFNSVNSCLTYLKIYEASVNVINKELKSLNKFNDLPDDKINRSVNFNKNLSDKNIYIFIKNLSYKYSNKKDFLLSNVNLKIKKGAKVAIIGRSGIGKSTLFNLIIGLMKPERGDILNYGKSIFASNLKNWRKNISLVSQNPYLLDSTIRNNITFNFFNEKININKLNKVIKVSQLSEKIENLENGLDTIVGNDGIKLSGGEKQRIAIARALYQDKDILMMDEFTSSLDKKTEKNIINNLKKYYPKKTILIISHRTSTIKYCDYFFKL